MSYTHLVPASPLIRRHMPNAEGILLGLALRRRLIVNSADYMLCQVGDICDAIVADTDICIIATYLTADCEHIALVFRDEADAVLWSLQNADLLEAA